MWNRIKVSKALSVGGLFGLGGTVSASNDESSKKTCPIQTIPKIEAKDHVMLSRKIVNHLDKFDFDLRLYQYQTCPFCCKVRAFLDYYGFSYEVVEVNPVTRSQIKFSKDYQKVPILKCKDHTLTESSLLISQLSTFLVRNDRSLEEILSMYPKIESVDEKGKNIIEHPNKYFVMLEKTVSDQQMANQKEERHWREWIDKWFIHLISPNVYRTWKESLETFRWFEKTGNWDINFPTWERLLAVYIGALAMFLLSKMLKKRHGIIDERAALKEACDEWVVALGIRPFLGGDKPNLADISLYGAMNSFFGCAAFKEVIENHKIGIWYNKMKNVVENHEGRRILEARSLAYKKSASQ